MKDIVPENMIEEELLVHMEQSVEVFMCLGGFASNNFDFPIGTFAKAVTMLGNVMCTIMQPLFTERPADKTKATYKTKYE